MKILREYGVPMMINSKSWFQSQASSTKLILCYHSISDGLADSGSFHSQRRCISLSSFEQQMRWLLANTDIVSLDCLLNRQLEDRPLVAITVDDGYAANEQIMFPLLESLSIPATWFITTSFVEDPKILPWWDLVDWVLETSRKDIALSTSEGNRKFDLRRLSARRQFRRIAQRLFSTASPEIRDQLINSIREQLGEGSVPDNAFVRLEHLKHCLHRVGLEIGGHTARHSNLRYCTRQQAICDVGDGLDSLERMTGIRPRWFAYPFGHADAISDITDEAVCMFELHGCCTLQAAPIYTNYDQRRIPRFGVSPAMSMARFKAMINFPEEYSRLLRISRA